MTLGNLSLDSMLQAVLNFLPNLGLALIIFVAARIISIWAARVLRRTLQSRGHDQELIVLVQLIARWGILAIGFVWALEQIAPGRFGTLLAGLGVAGFTIGFALQDVAKNFIAGLLILLLQPFRIGDGIEIGDVSGEVLAINLRSTEIRAVDGRYVIIPNADVFSSTIINYTRTPRRRIAIPIGVSYDADLDRVTKVALETLDAVDGVLKDPSPQVVFDNFGGSTIDFTLYIWWDTESASLLPVTNTVVAAIKKAFERERIEMPFPTQEIILKGKT
ncbi:MAG: mechanosensitive ion channel family protein [Anaerolineales bacterium]